MPYSLYTCKPIIVSIGEYCYTCDNKECVKKKLIEMLDPHIVNNADTLTQCGTNKCR